MAFAQVLVNGEDLVTALSSRRQLTADAEKVADEAAALLEQHDAFRQTILEQEKMLKANAEKLREHMATIGATEALLADLGSLETQLHTR